MVAQRVETFTEGLDIQAMLPPRTVLQQPSLCHHQPRHRGVPPYMVSRSQSTFTQSLITKSFSCGKTTSIYLLSFLTEFSVDAKSSVYIFSFILFYISYLFVIDLLIQIQSYTFYNYCSQTLFICICTYHHRSMCNRFINSNIKLYIL